MKNFFLQLFVIIVVLSSYFSYAKDIDITVINGRNKIDINLNQNQTFDVKYNYPLFSITFFPGFKNLDKPVIPLSSILEKINFVHSNGEIKSINFYLKNKIQYLVSREKNRLNIILIKKKDKSKKIILQDLKFTKDENNNLYIKLQFPHRVDYTLKSSKDYSLDILLPKAYFPDSLVKIYDLEEFKSCIKNIFLKNSPKGGIVHLCFFKRQPINISNNSRYFLITVPPLKLLQPEAQSRKKDITTQKMAIDEEEGTLFPGMKKKYKGELISIDLQNADIKHVLRLLAKVGGFNIIFDENVKGNITLQLQNVPWDQILDLVLLQKNLGMVKHGNIIRVAPISKIQKEQELVRRAMEQKRQLEPLITKYLKVNYTTAAEVSPKLEKFLTKRGSISYDTRTNQLIVCDTKEVVGKIERVLKRLDQPERQVLIEARVVYATESFQRGLGIKWGGGFNTGASYGGPQFDIGLYGTQGDTTATSSVSPSGFAINLPNEAGTTLGIGGYISKISGSTLFTLDAQLSLGESQGEVNTISSPRIVTLNNQQAEVMQGTKIATKTESESGGTTTQYQDALLKLSVIPHITPDNNLILDITISDDSPVGGGEDIETKSARTKLMVKDGETIVIGGVQRVSESRQQERVPFLAKIPIIGNVFKNRYKSREKRELLIFIRPKILED